MDTSSYLELCMFGTQGVQYLEIFGNKASILDTYFQILDALKYG